MKLALGYADTCAIRNQLGRFMLGDTVLFAGLVVNKIHVSEIHKNTLKELMIARLKSSPKHPKKDLLQQYINSYDIISQDMILQELT